MLPAMLSSNYFDFVLRIFPDEIYISNSRGSWVNLLVDLVGQNLQDLLEDLDTPNTKRQTHGYHHKPTNHRPNQLLNRFRSDQTNHRFTQKSSLHTFHIVQQFTWKKRLTLLVFCEIIKCVFPVSLYVTFIFLTLLADICSCWTQFSVTTTTKHT